MLARGDTAILAPTLIAITALVCSQVIFWVWTYPANIATEQWTAMPATLQELRVQWEYSHAAGAIFQLIALAALVVAAVVPMWRVNGG